MCCAQTLAVDVGDESDERRRPHRRIVKISLSPTSTLKYVESQELIFWI